MDEQPEVSKNIIDRRNVASHGLFAFIAFLLGLATRGTQTAPVIDPDRDLVGIVSTALDRGQTFWSSQVNGTNSVGTWRDARVVLIPTTGDQTPCGAADSTTGPYYCPPDQHIYLDLTFLRAINGDLARAYVVAHELGHHVQALRSELTGASVDIELQADCYAGEWMREEQVHGHLAVGDVIAALAEAAAVGDDRICPSCSQEQWTHGSAAQRAASLQRGLDGRDCSRGAQ